MNRRDFFKAGLSGAALAMSGAAAAAERPFGLNFAPEFRTFRQNAGLDELDNLRFMHQAGFRALQDLGMNLRPVEQQAAIGRELERLGMAMGAFLINQKTFKTTDLALGAADARQLFLTEVGEAIEVAKRVNAKWMVAVPGFESPRLDRARQISNIAELFKRAAAMLEKQGLVMVVEPVSWVDGQLLIRDLADGHLLCKSVGSPSCKLLCDVFHQQIQRGDLLDQLEQTWDEIAYFHIGDVPGRCEPGSGEINYRNLFSYLKAKNFQGILGMEHDHSRPNAAGELASVAAYREADRDDGPAAQAILRALPQRLNWR